MDERKKIEVRGTGLDPARARASIRRLMDIYRGMSQVADEMSLKRCPYKDASARCTAKFDCRNQYFIPNRPDERAVCTGSDLLDYRKAWEV